MEIVYYNGEFMPKEKVSISPDDRGFLLADGIYEVVRWYGKDFFDMTGHLSRLKRSMGELDISWDESEMFPAIAEKLIRENGFETKPAMVYLQVTRGAAKRTHYFPIPGVKPTVYAYAFTFIPDEEAAKKGIQALLKDDIRWSRCDIKSIALLPNTMSFQEAYKKGLKECIFARDGIITECSHSNIFFVSGNTIFTHPESNYILSGITRKNVIRIAEEAGVRVIQNAVRRDDIVKSDEAFITNTSSEVLPVIRIGEINVGTGIPGPVTRLLQEKLRKEVSGCN